MSRSQKVMLIGLVVLVLMVFVYSTVHGTKKSSDCGTPDDCARSYKPSSATSAMGRWFGPFAPRVRLDKTRFALVPGGPPVEVELPAADKAFRVLRLQLKQGAAVHAVYIDRASASDSSLHRQVVDLKASASDEKAREATLTVMKQGGVVTLQCVGGAPCEVTVP